MYFSRLLRLWVLLASFYVFISGLLHADAQIVIDFFQATPEKMVTFQQEG